MGLDGRGMYFEQLYLGCLAHASYLIGSDGEAAVVDPRRDVDDYLRVANEHKGTQAAGRAIMLAGTTLFAQGQYEDAQKQFEKFTREYPASSFVPEALYGVASCLEAIDDVARVSFCRHQDDRNESLCGLLLELLEH